MPARLALECLERRDTPAYTFVLVGLTASLGGNTAGDTLVITASGGLLQHNRGSAGDPGVASDFDWNSSTAGVQTLAASTAVVVSIGMGGGNDTLQLGTPGAPARNLNAHVSLNSGGAGDDRLIVDNTGSTAGDTYTYTSTQVTAPGLTLTTTTVLELGEEYRCGTGNDSFLVQSASNDLFVQGTGGSDFVTVGSTGSMEAVTRLVAVGNTSGRTGLTLNDSNDPTGDDVTFTSAGGRTTSSGLSSGGVAFTHGEVLDLLVFAGSGGDTFNWAADNDGLSATVLGGPGGDAFTVNPQGNVFTALTFSGQDGDDTFAVTAPPQVGVTLVLSGDGGTDTAALAAPAGGSPQIRHLSSTAGSAALAAGTVGVQFETLEGVSLAGTPAQVLVFLPNTPNPDVVVGDDGTAADPDGTETPGFSLVSGSTFTPTAVANPTTQLFLGLGSGGNTVTFTGMDAAYPGSVTLSGRAAPDTFVITPGVVPVSAGGGGPDTAPGDTLVIPVVVPGATAAGSAGTAGALTYTTMEAVRLTWDDAQVAAGADRGGGSVRFLDPNGSDRFTLAPFGPAFAGGVRVASADFTGDGVADVVAGTGPGGPTRVVVIDGATRRVLFDAAPFEPAFVGGVYVAAGDITGDGVPELVITPDEGGGPRVTVLSGKGFVPVADFFGIDDPNFRGGARAAVGDVDGDGFGELVVAAGFGGGPRVAVFRGTGFRDGFGEKLLGDFFLFEQGLRNGAFIAVGDVNADGFADLLGGGGPGGAPRVLILNGTDLMAGKGEGAAVLANFFAGEAASRGGARVAARHLDADATADVVVGAGSGAGSRVTAYLGKTLAPAGTPAEALAFDAFPGFAGGVFVG